MFSSVLRMCVVTAKGSTDKDRLNHGVISIQEVGGQMSATFDPYLLEHIYIHTRPRPPHLSDLGQINVCINIQSSSTEKEEKAITEIKKEPIPVDLFLLKLRQKKLDKILNFEVRVSCLIVYILDNLKKTAIIKCLK